LVPVAAQQDALTAARYRAFILPRLIGSLVALASFPIYLVLRGVPNGIEIAVFSWLITPIVIVYFLVRTGRYETAHILSSLSLSALIVLVAFFAGGIGSFAAIGLVVVPLEATLSGSRRVVLISAAVSLAAGLMLLMLGMAGLIRPNSADMHAALATLAIVFALLYATGLGLGAASLVGTGAKLLGAEENRYQLLIGNMTDVIIRCSKGGSSFSLRRRPKRCSAFPSPNLSATNFSNACTSLIGLPFLPNLPMRHVRVTCARLNFVSGEMSERDAPASSFGSKCGAGRSNACRPNRKKQTKMSLRSFAISVSERPRRRN
jgi:hypothetical protein